MNVCVYKLYMLPEFRVFIYLSPYVVAHMLVSCLVTGLQLLESSFNFATTGECVHDTGVDLSKILRGQTKILGGKRW